MINIPHRILACFILLRYNGPLMERPIRNRAVARSASNPPAIVPARTLFSFPVAGIAWGRWASDWGVVAGLILLAWLLRLYRLAGPSLWYDEGYTVMTARLPVAEMVRWVAGDLTPPLYNFVQHLLLPLLGWSEFTVRFLSVWTGTLVVATFVRLGRDLDSRLAGVLSGLLAAVAPLWVWYSQEARTYMLQALLGLLGTLWLLRALRHPRRIRLWLGLAAFDALLVYTQVTSGFLLVLHGLLILASLVGRERRWRLIGGGTALAAVALTWLPWLIYALPFLGQNAGYWPGQLDWRLVVTGAFRGFVGGPVMRGAAAEMTAALWAVAGSLALLTLVLSPGKRWRVALLLAAYFAAPVAAMAVLFRNVPKFSPQYLIVAAPPVLLLPALGAATLARAGSWAAPRRLLAGSALAALIATSGVGLGNLYGDPSFDRFDFRRAAQVVREQMAPGETVILVPGPIFAVWEYYYGPEGWLPLPDDPVLNVEHVLHYRNTVTRLNEWLDGRSGVWLVEWEPRTVDPTDVVGYLLAEVGQETTGIEQPVGLSLRHYRLLPERLPLPSEPAVAPPLDASLDLPLNALGCVLPQRVRGDEEIRLGCYWQAQQTLPLHLAVSLRLVDEAGAEWGRSDAPISGPDLVAERWQPGEAVLGQYALRLYAGVPPGDFYRLQLLVYEPGGPQRGVVTAGGLTVERPAAPYTATLVDSQASTVAWSGLVLEGARVEPAQLLPGDTAWVWAAWRVDGPFDEPRLLAEGAEETAALLPQVGATAAWQVGDRYLTVSPLPLSPYVAGGPLALYAVSADGRVELGQVEVAISRSFDVPANVPPVTYGLGEAISLVGVQCSTALAVTGATAEVVLYWRAEGFVERAYTVFVHLVGPDGQLVGQADGPPQDGRHPTTHWLPGEVVADTHRLPLPAGASPGVYGMLVGLYDPTTLERLPAHDAVGARLPDDAIPAARFELP